MAQAIVHERLASFVRGPVSQHRRLLIKEDDAANYDENKWNKFEGSLDSLTDPMTAKETTEVKRVKTMSFLLAV